MMCLLSFLPNFLTNTLANGDRVVVISGTASSSVGHRCCCQWDSLVVGGMPGEKDEAFPYELVEGKRAGVIQMYSAADLHTTTMHHCLRPRCWPVTTGYQLLLINDSITLILSLTLSGCGTKVSVLTTVSAPTTDF